MGAAVATSGVMHAVMPCGVTRLVVGRYRALWCRSCWVFHEVSACEVRPL
jgi:hypothetical protein